MHQIKRPALLKLAAFLGAVAAGLATLPGGSVAHAHTPLSVTAPTDADTRPNIVLFMTDDQNLDELRWMPKARSLLGDHGVTFTSALSPAPLCCPARAMTVTGQYGQNNGVQANRGPYGGFKSLIEPENTLAVWLRAAGYQTAFIGKYLNGYDGPDTVRQAGWTRWNPSVGTIYGYLDTVFLTNDGARTRATGNVTPYISGRTAAYVQAFSKSDQPFFIWASHVPPHSRQVWNRQTKKWEWYPPYPTRQHSGDLGGVLLPASKKPSFNAVGTGPDPYGELSPLSGKKLRALQEEFTGRLRTLQDADDAVERLVEVLRETGELANTYIVFVSDNGMLLGEHQLVAKDSLYREALEIPLVVRVPGASQAALSDVPVTIVDLAPTLLDLAGATPGRVLDGRSFAPILRGGTVAWRDTQLVQTSSNRATGPQPGWGFRGVRTARYTYMNRVADGAEFLYDRLQDPFEMDNVAPDPSYGPVLEELRRRYEMLITCAGDSCNQAFPALPDPQ